MKKVILYITCPILVIVSLAVLYFLFFLFCPLVPIPKSVKTTDDYEVFTRKFTNAKSYGLYPSKYMYKTINYGDRVHIPGGFQGCSQISVYANKKLFVYHFSGYDELPGIFKIIEEYLPKFKDEKLIHIDVALTTNKDRYFNRIFKVKLRELLNKGNYKYKIKIREYYEPSGISLRKRYYHELMVSPFGLISKLIVYPENVFQDSYIQKDMPVLFVKNKKNAFMNNEALYSPESKKWGGFDSLIKINIPNDNSGYSIYEINHNPKNTFKLKSNYEYRKARNIWCINNDELKYSKVVYENNNFVQKLLTDNELEAIFGIEKIIKISQFKDNKIVIKKPIFKRYQTILLNDTGKDFKGYKIKPLKVSHDIIKGLLTIKRYGVIKLYNKSKNDTYMIYVVPCL